MVTPTAPLLVGHVGLDTGTGLPADTVFTMAIKASGRAAHLFVEPAVFAALPPDTPAADVALVYGECPPDAQVA